jgi:hypothetical protein
VAFLKELAMRTLSRRVLPTSDRTLKPSAPGRRRRPEAPPRVEALEPRCLPSVDVVMEWNAIALDALKNDSLLTHPRQNNPGSASRALAIVQAAVFDAVNSLDRSYEPYLIEVNAPRGASLTAAAAQAAHDTLASLFPEYQAVLDARLANDLAGGGSVLSRVEGVLVGHVVATAILAVRSNDGSGVSMNWPVNTAIGHWQPDPLHPNQSAWGPEWGAVTPFTLTSSTQFRVPPPPALTSADYATAYNEVKSIGAVNSTTRTAEQTQIGIFWGYDGSPGLGTPPRMYNQIAEVLANQMHNSVVQNARFFALINLAMADAGMAAWEAKYQYDFWRPVTAIRAGGADGNPLTAGDPTWAPLGAPADNGGGTNFTPPFPAYTSGHATFGGALFRVMADFFGRDDIAFTIGSDEFNGVTSDQNGVVRPVVTRSFTSFSQAAEENGQSRIYLGIHWSFDKVQGILLGDRIADYVFNNFLRPVGGCGGRGFEVDGDTELAFAVTGSAAGPVLSPVPPGPAERDVPDAFRIRSGSTPVDLVVKVEASRLRAAAQGNPADDLDAALTAPTLLRPT